MKVKIKTLRKVPVYCVVASWVSMANSFIYTLTDNIEVSAILSSFSPLLFILFGMKNRENINLENSSNA